jgi:hypothetical protein
MFLRLSLPLSYRFTWTKEDKVFDLSDPRIIVSNNSGTFKILNEGHISHFQGKYRCFASNKLGVAMSEEIEFIVPSKCYKRFHFIAVLIITLVLYWRVMKERNEH